MFLIRCLVFRTHGNESRNSTLFLYGRCRPEQVTLVFQPSFVSTLLFCPNVLWRLTEGIVPKWVAKPLLDWYKGSFDIGPLRPHSRTLFSSDKLHWFLTTFVSFDPPASITINLLCLSLSGLRVETEKTTLRVEDIDLSVVVNPNNLSTYFTVYVSRIGPKSRITPGLSAIDDPKNWVVKTMIWSTHWNTINELKRLHINENTVYPW